MAKKVGNGKPMVEDKSKPAREEAIKALQQDQKERVEACIQEIKAALQKHSCELYAEAYIDKGIIKAEPKLMPK